MEKLFLFIKRNQDNIKNGNVFAETIENNYLSFLRNINKSLKFHAREKKFHATKDIIRRRNREIGKLITIEPFRSCIRC